MCLSNIFYPLILCKDDKKKTLFNYPIYINKHFGLENFQRLKKDFLLYNTQGYINDNQTLSRLLDKSNYKDFVKFIQVPCGQCPQCLSSRSKSISFRLLNQAYISKNNYFITFTYADDKLPVNMSLDKKVVSNFNKKLRTYLHRKGLSSDFKFFAVGEYGSSTYRPHYHFIYYDLEIPDLHYEYTKDSFNHFSSKFLQDTWSNGFVDIGSVDIGSIFYVSRYCDKKRLLTKEEKKLFLQFGLEPEFQLGSKNLGLYNMDVLKQKLLNDDNLVFLNGKTFNIPKFYKEKLIEKDYSYDFDDYVICKLSNIVVDDNIFDYNNYISSIIKESKLKLNKRRL